MKALSVGEVRVPSGEVGVGGDWLWSFDLDPGLGFGLDLDLGLEE